MKISAIFLLFTSPVFADAVDDVSQIATIFLCVLGLVIAVMPIFIYIRLGELVISQKRANELLEWIGQLQQSSIAAVSGLTKPTSSPNPSAAVVKRTVQEVEYRVSKNGREIGTMTAKQISRELRRGGILPEDAYFDTESEEWLAVSGNPEFT